MDRTRLSTHFWLDEFERSQVAARLGIDTRIDPEGPIAANLRRLCAELLQPLRDALGPVFVTSGYRPPALNRAIGGAERSAHLNGRAADIVVPGQAPADVARWAVEHLDGYDQVILEFGRWVHLAIAPEGEAPRRQALTSALCLNRVTYREGIIQ